MTTQAILSSNYFPCIAYFGILLKHESILLDIGEHYVKQSYRNRAIIYTSNGGLALSVPVIRRNKTAVKDVLLDSRTDWKKNHWRAISSAYNSSPFFEFYEHDLKNVFFEDYENLVELNYALIRHLCSEIGINKKLNTSESFIEANEISTDYRHVLDAKNPTNGSNHFERYIQIFENKHGFIRNLSILDLLFHEGPETLNYLKNNTI